MQFQHETMEVNAITLLFSITFNSEFKQHEEEVGDIDLEDSTFEITQNCLNVQIIETI